jgi:hypothetical protein
VAGTSGALPDHLEKLLLLFWREGLPLCQKLLDHQGLHLLLAREDVLLLRLDGRPVGLGAAGR